jgi:hypothetical protein
MTDAPFVAASQGRIARRRRVGRAAGLVAHDASRRLQSRSSPHSRRQPAAAMLAGLAAAAIASARREQALIPLVAVGGSWLRTRCGSRTAIGANLPLVERAADALAFMRRVDRVLSSRAHACGGISSDLWRAAPAALAAGEWNDPADRCAFAVLVTLELARLGRSRACATGAMWGACEMGGARSLLPGHPLDAPWSRSRASWRSCWRRSGSRRSRAPRVHSEGSRAHAGLSSRVEPSNCR